MKKTLALLVTSSLLFTGLTQVTQAQTIDSDTSEASITFTEGALTLVQVNNIDFGTYTIGENPTNTYTAENAQAALVTDYRGLAAGEWYLTASVSNFTDENDVTTLPGFNLQFNEGTASANVATNVLIGPSVNNPSLNFVDEENGSVNFLSATDGEARGSWTGLWSEVLLSIPEGSETVGEHVATITWGLSDAPQ